MWVTISCCQCHCQQVSQRNDENARTSRPTPSLPSLLPPWSLPWHRSKVNRQAARQQEACRACFKMICHSSVIAPIGGRTGKGETDSTWERSKEGTEGEREEKRRRPRKWAFEHRGRARIPHTDIGGGQRGEERVDSRIVRGR